MYNILKEYSIVNLSLLVGFCLLASGCGVKTASSPEAAIQGYYQNMKNGNISEAKKFLSAFAQVTMKDELDEYEKVLKSPDGNKSLTMLEIKIDKCEIREKRAYCLQNANAGGSPEKSKPIWIKTVQDADGWKFDDTILGNDWENYKDNAIIDAVHSQNKEALLAAIGKNENMNAMDESGRTPLMMAYMLKRYDLMKILLNAGADPDQKAGAKTEGEPVIVYAITQKNTEAVKTLLEGGVNVSAESGGASLIEYARMFGNAEIIKLLQAAGAK